MSANGWVMSHGARGSFAAEQSPPCTALRARGADARPWAALVLCLLGVGMGEAGGGG